MLLYIIFSTRKNVNIPTFLIRRRNYVKFKLFCFRSYSANGNSRTPKFKRKLRYYYAESIEIISPWGKYLIYYLLKITKIVFKNFLLFFAYILYTIYYQLLMLYLFIYENYFMYRKFIICECYTSSIIRASISMRTWKPSCKLNTLVKGKWSFENRHWLPFNLSASSAQNVICSFCEILTNSKFRTCFCHNFMKKKPQLGSCCELLFYL